MPCTVVNSIISIVLAALLAVIWIPLGIAGLIVFGAAIYVRGYLVPGTPYLTQRYFPEWLLQLFGKEPVQEPAETTSIDGPVEVDQLLLDASVVEPCAHEDDLCLTEEFEASWWDRIRRLRGDEAGALQRLASITDVPAGELDLEDRDGERVLIRDERTIGRWDSEAAYLADMAVEPLLAERIPDWDDLAGRVRTQALAGLRVFLDACPVCETDLEQVENVRESCCGSNIVGVSIECPECETRLFTGSIR